MQSTWQLQGIGPATASAVLAVAQPAFPFMSDEAMSAAVKGPIKYTVPEYVQLVEALQGKAAELNEGAGEHTLPTLTARLTCGLACSLQGDGRWENTADRCSSCQEPWMVPDVHAMSCR